MNGPRMRRGCSWGEQVEERGGIVFFFSFLFFSFSFSVLEGVQSFGVVLVWIAHIPLEKELRKIHREKRRKKQGIFGEPRLEKAEGRRIL